MEGMTTRISSFLLSPLSPNEFMVQRCSVSDICQLIAAPTVGNLPVAMTSVYLEEEKGGVSSSLQEVHVVRDVSPG